VRSPESRTAPLRVRELGLVAVALVSIPFFDVPLAQAIRGSALEDAWLLQGGTWLLDWITGKEIWRYLLATLLVVPGLLLLFASERHRRLGAALLFVGLVHLSASLIVVVAKPLFGRLRPDELLSSGAESAWFVGGSSFPSGHTAFYFGLFLPLAWLLPQWRAALLVIPCFIGLARIDANDHFLADVCASIALASFLTLLFAYLLRRWLPDPRAQHLA